MVYCFARARPGGELMSKLVDQTPMRRSMGWSVTRRFLPQVTPLSVDVVV